MAAEIAMVVPAEVAAAAMAVAVVVMAAVKPAATPAKIMVGAAIMSLSFIFSPQRETAVD